MSNITKEELIRLVAENSDQTLATTQAVLDALKLVVTGSVYRGETVFWRGFFTAKLKTVEAREYSTPKGKFTSEACERLHLKASLSALQ